MIYLSSGDPVLIGWPGCCYFQKEENQVNGRDPFFNNKVLQRSVKCEFGLQNVLLMTEGAKDLLTFLKLNRSHSKLVQKGTRDTSLNIPQQ